MAAATTNGITVPLLTAETFDSFWLHYQSQTQTNRAIALDLRGVSFIDMFASVKLLYCCTELLDRYSCQVELLLDDSGACTFLPRIGFFTALDSRVILSPRHSLSQFSGGEVYRGSSRMIIELTSIDSYATIRKIINHVMDVLANDLHYPDSQVHDLVNILSELCHNVPEHAGSQANGLVAMQLYRGGRYGPFMQFVVADQGVGIQETLRRNSQYSHLTDDINAIVTSLQPRVSEHVDASRGNGLAFLVERVQRLNGRLHIRSGRGKVYIRTEPPDFRHFRVAPLAGTQVSVTFPAHDVTT